MSVKKCIFKYCKENPLKILLCVLIIVADALFTLVPPILIKMILDDGINGGAEVLLRLSLLYLGGFLCIALADFAKEIILIVLGQGVIKEIRLNLAKHLQKVGYFTAKQLDTGNTEAYFSGDTEAVGSLIGDGVLSMAVDAVKVVGILVSIFVFNYVFGFITLLLLPIIGLLVVLFRRISFKANLKNRKTEAQVSGEMFQILDNSKTVRVFSCEKYFTNRYEKVLKENYDTMNRANFCDASFPPLLYMLKSLTIACIALLAVSGAGVFGVSVGVFVAFIDLITNLFAPVDALGTEIQTIQKSLAAAKHIDGFFSLKEEIKRISMLNEQANFYTLRFENMSFRYEDALPNEFVFKDFKLMFKTPDKVVFTGASGCGKSTLFKLIYGVIKPYRGGVTLNNVPVSELTYESRKRVFGILFQDPYFSGGTVKEELTDFSNVYDEEKAKSALEAVGLFDRLPYPECYLEPEKLSGGERCLFNLARLIYADQPVWLIDELNSKIDDEACQKIISVLEKCGENKLIIFINHYGARMKNVKVVNVEKYKVE